MKLKRITEPDGPISMTARQLDNQQLHYRKRANQYRRKAASLKAIAITCSLATILVGIPTQIPFNLILSILPMTAAIAVILLAKGRYDTKAALLTYSQEQIQQLAEEASTLNRLVKHALLTPEQAHSVHKEINNRMWTTPGRAVLYPKTENYNDIAKEEGEKAAILAGIARDPDTAELTERDFQDMVSYREAFPKETKY